MSIRDVVAHKISIGMLHELPRRVHWITPYRAMLITPRLQDYLLGPWESIEEEDRAGRLWADLEVFVGGHTIDPKYLRRLYPARDEVWEIRSIRDDPSIRVVGGFVEKDFFVATNHAHRSELGGWQSRPWRDFKQSCKGDWNNLFHTYPRHSGASIHDYISNALDGKYFR
jgi:hypothetical protein